MRAKAVIYSGVFATTFMTLFSYLASNMRKKNFSEPELLGVLFQNLFPSFHKKFIAVVGWSSHYFIGVNWSAVYEFWLEKLNKKSSLKNAIVFGSISGWIAIFSWKTIFKLHPNPPKIDEEFYTQLFLAHLVFSLAATIEFANKSQVSSGNQVNLVNSGSHFGNK